MVPAPAYLQSSQTQTTQSSSSSHEAILKLKAANNAASKTTTFTTQSRLTAPLKLTNAFERRGIQHFNNTPAVGTEFEKGQLDLAELLERPEGDAEADELLRELAVMISYRGVVFVRHQPNLTPALMSRLATKLGELSGKPTSSKLHIHPLSKEFSELGEFKGEKIDSEADNEGRQISFKSEKSNFASAGWHTDISFEPVPADYSMLQLRTIPRSGGDTMWSSMYSAYDALSPAMKKFLEGMTAIHDAEDFREQSAKFGFPLYSKERGHPLNVGDKLQVSHPVIRTNPVTGYKALFINKSFTKRINELSIDESDAVLAYLFRLVAESFDFQVRFRWNVDDIALWDNRSSQHSGIFDFGKAKRVGDRCVSIGERPFYDPSSRSRAEALEGEKTEWEI